MFIRRVARLISPGLLFNRGDGLLCCIIPALLLSVIRPQCLYPELRFVPQAGGGTACEVAVATKEVCCQKLYLVICAVWGEAVVE